MRINRRVLVRTAIALLCCSVLLALLTNWLRPPEPIYDGHPISYWISRPINLAHSGPVVSYLDLTLEYSLSFPVMDSNAVPYLLPALRRSDGLFSSKGWYFKVWLKAPMWLQRRLPSPDRAASARYNAAAILSRFATLPPESVEPLIQSSRKGSSMALAALAHSGNRDQRAINYLLDVAQSSTNQGNRYFAIEGLLAGSQDAKIEQMFSAVAATNSAGADDLRQYGMSVLASGLINTTDPEKRLRIVQQMGRFGTVEHIDILRRRRQYETNGTLRAAEEHAMRQIDARIMGTNSVSRENAGKP